MWCGSWSDESGCQVLINGLTFSQWNDCEKIDDIFYGEYFIIPIRKGDFIQYCCGRYTWHIVFVPWE